MVGRLVNTASLDPEAPWSQYPNYHTYYGKTDKRNPETLLFKELDHAAGNAIEFIEFSATQNQQQNVLFNIKCKSVE